jgi:hypothetical protein
MVETLVTATLVEAGVTDEVVRITGITFEDGDLCKPRYPTLFDYFRAPHGVRFEPGFQILRSLLPRLRFLFQLHEDAGSEFLTDSQGHPVVVSILDPDAGQVPGLTAVLLDPVTCELAWDQAEADRIHGGTVKLTTLRLRCQPLGRTPTDPEKVDGGLYLAIVNHPEAVGLDLGIADPGEREEDTIKLLGSDSLGRPVYDLFRLDALTQLPGHMGLEPTFRVRQTDPPVDLACQIATLPEIDLRFVPAVGDVQAVHVLGFKPEGLPRQLLAAERLDQGRRCRLSWAPQQNGVRNFGESSSFYLEAVLEGQVSPSWAKWHGKVLLRLDPTVIQPPSCTGGICI